MKERAFLIVTFAISWGIELVLFLTDHLHGDDAVLNLVYPLIMCAPAFAALATKFVIKEPLGYGLWFKPQGRKTFKYVAAGWFGPVVLIAIGTGIYFLIFNNNFDMGMNAYIQQLRESDTGLKDFSNGEIRNTLLLNIVLNIFLAPLYHIFTSVGEEFGWRGYFLNMLCEKKSKFQAVLINGIVWGIWYFPLVVGIGLFYGTEHPGFPVTGCLLALIYCIVLGTIYSFLTIKTQSCVPAILANACVGAMGSVGTLFFKNIKDVNVFINPTPTSIVGGIGFLAAAGVILYYLYKDKIEPAPIKEEKVVSKEKKSSYAGGSSMKERLGKFNDK